MTDLLRAGGSDTPDALLPVEAMVEAFYHEDLLAEFPSGEAIAPPGE